uniref:Uncharacterized protein n=1 Tax=Arundo donax TaxID=35708 RepID=A0A0A8ZTM9_ARUDO
MCIPDSLLRHSNCVRS